MFKKLFITVTMLFMFQTNTLANDCPNNSIQVIDMLNSWSKSLNKKVILDVPSEYNYCVKFENEMNPNNNLELEQKISSLNLLLGKKDLLPLNVYSFEKTILIIPIIKNIKNK